MSFRRNARKSLSLLDDALERLYELSPRQSRVVELRFFAGLSVEEAAEVLGTSEDCEARLERCQSLAPRGANLLTIFRSPIEKVSQQGLATSGQKRLKD